MSKNIIFVLLDGARCDRLDESSDFRKLKKLGCLFDNIIAAYPYTFPAINSMFTGLFGKENGVDAYYKMFRLKKDVQVLPEILQQNGYFTSCDLISDKVISPRGFDIHQSHDEYNDDLVERHSDLILKSFQKSGGKPIFTFLQFSHIHMVTVSEVLKEFEWNDEEFYKMKKVVIALSGGVDSSVAAYLLKKQGYHVIGLFMKNWHDESVTISKECPWLDDSNDAMIVAQNLKIPFQTVDLSKEYNTRIIQYMFREYKHGRTPNPDILCNREIKFDIFMKIALDLGADFVATGHYSRINREKKEKIIIHKLISGVDRTT